MTKAKLYTPEAPSSGRYRWLGGSRNLLFIAIITLLIWVYADLENTEDRKFEAAILLTVGNSDNLAMSTASRSRIPVMFTLRGTSSSLMEFQNELTKIGQELLHGLSGELEAGEHSISVAEILNKNDLVIKAGLTAVTTTPRQVDITLDKRVSQAAIVIFDYAGASLSETPTIEPAQIIASMATADLDRIRQEQNTPAGEPITLKTTLVDLADFPSDKPQTIDVKVLAPTGQFIARLEPGTVKVTFKIDQRTDQKPFPVTVQLRFPHTWTEDGTWKDYEVVKKDAMEWQPRLTLSGSKKDLERLRPEDVEAHVVLVDDDKKPVASWLARPVTVRFPPGIDVRLVSAPPTVHFKLEKRIAPSPATP